MARLVPPRGGTGVGIAGFDISPPPLAELGSGFDAIVQLLDSVVQREGRMYLRELGTGTTLAISAADTALTAADRAYLKEHAPFLAMLPGSDGEPSSTPVPVFVPIGFRLVLSPPTFTLEPGTPGAATATWPASVQALYQETAASAAAHHRTPLTDASVLGSGTIVVRGDVQVDPVAGRPHASASFAVTTPVATLALPAGLFAGVAPACTAAFADLLAARALYGRIGLTPLVAFGGAAMTLAAAGFTGFHPQVCVLRGNQAGTTVLCLGFNFGGATGDVAELAPFTALGDVACFQTIETVHALATATFARLSSDDRAVEGEVAMPLHAVSGGTETGTGTIKLALSALAGIELQPYIWPDGRPQPRDPFRVTGTAHVTLEKLRRADGTAVDVSAFPAELRVADTAIAWQVFAFQLPPTDVGSVAAMRLLDKLMVPAIMPLPYATISKIHAQTSAAVGAIAFAGVLDA